MRRLVPAIALVLVVSGAGGVPAAPRAASLAGEVTVSGTTTGTMRVHAGRSFTLSGRDDVNDPEQRGNPDTAVKGRGRLVGVVLTRGSGSPKGAVGPSLLVLRYGMCGGRACSPVRGGLQQVWAFGPGVEEVGNGQDTSYRMPAGDYDLTLLTDGSPVTVSFRLHGLPGSAALTPRLPSPARLIEALATDPAGASYAADAHFRFRTRGMVLITALSRSDVHSQPAVTWCLSESTGEEDPATERANAETACAPRLAAATVGNLTGQPPGPGFGGSGSANGMTLGGGLPSGRVTAYLGVRAGPWRLQLQARPAPTEHSHAFLGLWFPWR